MAEYKRHQGHRQRMRERVQNYGLDSLADHEVLEYILYTTNAQRDTNEIAYNLLERFGDFASVLEASEEELCTVEGIGPTSARLLHMLPQVSRYYGRCRTDGKRCFKTTEQLGSYLMAKFAWSDYERAMLVSLSTRRHIKAAVWLREGTSDRVSLDVKDVVATAIKGGTDAVVLCHNHPQRSGSALHGGYGGHWQHCPGAGAGEHPSAGPLYPDRHGVLFHAGCRAAAHLRLQDRHTFLALSAEYLFTL